MSRTQLPLFDEQVKNTIISGSLDEHMRKVRKSFWQKRKEKTDSGTRKDEKIFLLDRARHFQSEIREDREAVLAW